MPKLNKTSFFNSFIRHSQKEFIKHATENTTVSFSLHDEKGVEITANGYRQIEIWASDLVIKIGHLVVYRPDLVFELEEDSGPILEVWLCDDNDFLLYTWFFAEPFFIKKDRRTIVKGDPEVSTIPK